MNVTFADPPKEPNTVPPEVLEEARNKFIYEMCRYFGERAGERDAAKLLGHAREVDRLLDNPSNHKLEKQTELILPLLALGHEQAWVKLLLWIGRQHHMLPQFKELSPFIGCALSIFRVWGDDKVETLFAPDREDVCVSKHTHNHNAVAAVVVPKGTLFSCF